MIRQAIQFSIRQQGDESNEKGDRKGAGNPEPEAGSQEPGVWSREASPEISALAVARVSCFSP